MHLSFFFSRVIEIGELCDLSSKPVVVMIDEVDQASNNDGFIKNNSTAHIFVLYIWLE